MMKMILSCNRLLCSDLLNFIGIFGVKQHDLLAEVTFNVAADVHGLLRIDEIDGDSVLAEATGSSNSMQVSLAVCTALLIHRQVKVHDNVNLIDVDTARQNVCGD